VILKKLNEQGLHEFESFIKSLRAGNQQNIPLFLLESGEYAEALPFQIEVAGERQFKSRFEMGCYLVELFSGHNIQKYIGDRGFWSWFALLWFEQLCPLKNGKLKPSQPYNYILSTSYNHRPRHAIYMTWQLVNRYGNDAHFMLCKEMSTRGEITEQMMARQEILSSESAIRLANLLYFDAANKSFKKGSAARKSAGCVSRYISWIQQLQVTFDIHSIKTEDLEALLPKEFDRFRSRETAAIE